MGVKEEKMRLNVLGVPESLADWTFNTIADLVERHTFEPDWFDFKEYLNSPAGPEEKSKHNVSVRQTACSMANTDGGYIIFGVKDRGSQNDSGDRLPGILLAGDLRSDFARKLELIRPNLPFDASPRPIPVPNDPKRGIFVVWFNRSPFRPHMDEDTHRFYARGRGGTSNPMGWQEVRDQMLNTEDRLRRLSLLRMQLATFREVVSLIEGERTGVVQALDRFETGVYGGLLSDVVALLPDDPELMRRLLRVPILARRVNVGLDRFQASGRGQEFNGDRITNALNELVNILHECQVDLEKRFGPLPPPALSNG